MTSEARKSYYYYLFVWHSTLQYLVMLDGILYVLVGTYHTGRLTSTIVIMSIVTCTVLSTVCYSECTLVYTVLVDSVDTILLS